MESPTRIQIVDYWINDEKDDYFVHSIPDAFTALGY